MCLRCIFIFYFFAILGHFMCVCIYCNNVCFSVFFLGVLLMLFCSIWSVLLLLLLADDITVSSTSSSLCGCLFSVIPSHIMWIHMRHRRLPLSLSPLLSLRSPRIPLSMGGRTTGPGRCGILRDRRCIAWRNIKGPLLDPLKFAHQANRLVDDVVEYR